MNAICLSEKENTMNAKVKQQAWRIQYHWNTTLAKEERSDLLARCEGRLTRLFERLGLTATCQDCFCIFAPYELDHDENGWGCPECGSTDVDSPWGNPVRQREE